MSKVTFDSLRWLEQPAQVTVTVNGGPPRAYFQATSPRDAAALCKGRLVEELPRILSILSPAHHLCAAQALDRLFNVEPPAVALNMREALRRVLFVRHFLRKFYFLASSQESPFAELRSREVRPGKRDLHGVVQDLSRHLSLAQEAAIILGGRADHPVTAVAGGVSRSLREEHHPRLAEIAAACRDCAVRLSAFVREDVFPAGKLLADVQDIAVGPLASLSLAPEPDRLILRDAKGKELERFATTALFDKVALQREPWSYEPFAFLKDKGWKDLAAGSAESLFFVGPLARLNGGEAVATPLAEAERLRLVEAMGPFPHGGVLAAYWAMLVQLLEAAEVLVATCEVEKLSGPAPRTIPTALGQEGHAALESPQGLIYHRFRADERGVVQEAQILDAATANNALLALLAQRAVEEPVAQSKPWEVARKRVELSLLPF